MDISQTKKAVRYTSRLSRCSSHEQPIPWFVTRATTQQRYIFFSNSTKEYAKNNR
nr:MAG TPA: hypothetical protein [Caudoviricetes sp.]